MRLDDSILVGAFQGWAEPSGDDPESGSYPFVFDVPDYDRYHSLELPVVLGVQVAAFAHKLEAYASDEAYYAAQHREPKFAAESFIPSGLFTLGGEAMTPPQALAILTGHVLDTALLTNPATGATFHWAWVRTLGGEVDVAADPEVPTGSLVPGGVISGSFWLSGRLLNYT